MYTMKNPDDLDKRDEAALGYYLGNITAEPPTPTMSYRQRHNASSDCILTETEKEKRSPLSWAKDKAKSGMTKKMLYRRIPILSWLPSYNADCAVGDIVAGITVGLTVIPQSLAYSNIAGLPPQYGLYGSFFGCFLYILMGSCKDVPMGPTAIASLLTYQSVKGFGPEHAILLCFLGGCVSLLMGLLGLGFIIDFVSGPVSSGFTSAVALIIVTSQIKDILGIPASGATFLEMWQSIFSVIDQTTVADTVFGIVCIVILLLMRLLVNVRIGPNEADKLTTGQRVFNKTMWLISTARNAILVIICGIIGWWFSQGDEPAPFKLIGDIPPGMPAFQAPQFGFTNGNTTYTFGDMVSNLGSGVIVLPLVALLETIAICKAFSGGKAVDATQELIAIGICNMGNAFFQGFPGAGSLSRSAVNNSSGVRTPFGSFYTGLLVVLALLFFTPYFEFIPKTSLAAIIIAAVVFMVEVHVVVPMWNTKKSDLIPGIGCFIGCLVLPLEFGILVGVGINVLFILYHAARPKIAIDKQMTRDGVEFLILTPDRSLIFPSVDYVRNLVTKHSIKNAVPVVIDCTHIYGADFTAAKVIECLTQDFASRKQPLFFYNLKKSVVNVFNGLQPKDFVVYHSEDQLDDLVRAHTLQQAESETLKEVSVITTG